jgi:hypothetical protein
MRQDLSLLSEDMQVEGAGFFPLDHYECLNEFLGTGSTTSGQGVSTSRYTYETFSPMFN